MRAGALLAALAVALLPAGTAAAEPPWQAAERTQAALFDAQTELLLDAPAGGVPPASPRAVARVAAASRAFRGPLAAGLREDAPAALRDARAALRAAAAAVARGDQIGLAAARGRLRAAVLRGSYEVTLAAVQRGDARTAARWLLLREFRQATRFTRPGVDATNAVRRLRGRAASPARTGLAVRKDLLDAYQARLLDELEEAAGANAKGFRARRAEAAAIAAGYFEILASEYEDQRGQAALAGRACRVPPAGRGRRRRRPGRLRRRARRSPRGPRRIHGRAVHTGGAGPQGPAARPLPRPRADRVPRRHGRRKGHDPVRDPGGDRLPRRGGGGLRRPRGGAGAPRRARGGRRRARSGSARGVRRGRRERPQGGGRGRGGGGARAGRRAARRALPGRVEGGRLAGRLRPHRPDPRPHGGRRGGRRVEAGRAGPPRGVRVLRVRPGAEPPLARPGRGGARGGARLVRRRRRGGPRAADRARAPGTGAARVAARARRGAARRRRGPRRGCRDHHGGHQRGRDRLPRGTRGGADPRGGHGQPARTGEAPPPPHADRGRARARGERDHVRARPDGAHLAGPVRREARGDRRPHRDRRAAAGAELVLPPRLLDRPPVAVPQAAQAAARDGRDGPVGVAGRGLRAARLLDRLPRGLRDRAVPPGARAELGSLDRAPGRGARRGGGPGGRVPDLQARAQAALQANADRDGCAAHGRARDHGRQDRADDAGRGLDPDHAARLRAALLGGRLARASSRPSRRSRRRSARPSSCLAATCWPSGYARAGAAGRRGPTARAGKPAPASAPSPASEPQAQASRQRVSSR